MANAIFNRLLKEQIDNFTNSFLKVSEGLFKKQEDNKLIHPGEFGLYREAICKRFLEFVVPKKLSIDTGFLINSNDEVSTQCDIIIYDSNNTPLIQSNELQRFYPTETVCAVGEIKSNLSKKEFNKALNKLSATKKIAEHYNNSQHKIIHPPNKTVFNPKFDELDQILTFLICKKLDFDLDNFEFEYDKGVKDRHYHNMILSIEDGLYLYADKTESMTLFPVEKGVKNDFAFYSRKNGKYDYIKVFAKYIFDATSRISILSPDLSDYMIYPETDDESTT